MGTTMTSQQYSSIHSTVFVFLSSFITTLFHHYGKFWQYETKQAKYTKKEKQENSRHTHIMGP